MKEQFFFARHTDRPDKSDSPESERYEWITEKGVELARQTAQDVIKMVDEAAPNAVVVIAGSSEEARTKSTSEVIGDALAENYKDNSDVVVLTRSQIDTIRNENSNSEGFKFLDEVKQILNNNPENKVVINYPLFLKGFSLRPHFRDKAGFVTELNNQIVATARQEYAEDLAQVDASQDSFLRTKEEEASGAKAYMRLQGPEEAHALGGQTPQEYAEAQLRDINRLRDFVRSQVGEREIVVGFVGHAWSLDALASYLANQGQADYEGFQATGDRMIQLAEMGKVVIDGEEAIFTYRGKEFEIPAEQVNRKKE